MGVTSFLLVSLGLAMTAQGQNCDKPVGGPSMSLKDSDILLPTFQDGSRVSFACDVGYESAGGSSVITCNAGAWSPVRLKCQRKNCGSPGIVENGQIDSSEGTEFGDKIVITCNEGYEFLGKEGPREIFCGDQGWDDRWPVCEAVSCYPPQPAANGMFSPIKDSYKFGEVVQYTCQKGFKLIGSNSVTCSIEGTFDSDPPVCAKVQCEDVEIPNSEKVGGSQPPYGHQATVTYNCKSGFKLKGESTVTCDIDSQWVPKLPECELVTCKPPKTVADGKFSPIKDSYNYGEVVQYRCQQGLTLNGSDSASCSNEGTFDSDPPVCVKVQCEDFEIPNGEFAGGSRPPHGYQETVTCKCKFGFKTKGESTVTCDINSQWSPKLPECEVVTCKPPKTVADGKFSPIKDSYSFGEVVQYSCEQDFTLSGSKSVTCSIEGTFKPDPPKCTEAAPGPL